MEIGKFYDVVYLYGSYDIEYEDDVKCTKINPKSYRVERKDGSTTLINQDSIMDLTEITPNGKKKIISFPK